jgi:superfamily I DNA/RNA helicase
MKAQPLIGETLTIRLTPEQEAYAAHSRFALMSSAGIVATPAVALAVAGSGKTTSTCALVKNAVTAGHRATDIIVATFSKAGASDMAARASRLAVQAGISWRTLHAIGWAVVCEITCLGGNRPGRRDPVIIDPQGPNGWWVKGLLKEYLESQAKLAPKEEREDILNSGRDVFSEIGLAAAHLIWPEAWTASNGDIFPAYEDWAQARDRQPATPLLARLTTGFYALWEEVKAAPEKSGLKSMRGTFEAPKPSERRLARTVHPLTPRPTHKCDRALVRWFSYDDQIAWPARWALEGKGFMKRFAGVFSLVVVDEAQDNNLAQNVLATHLARKGDDGRPSLILVGDDQQSIYGFRGSQPGLMGEFIAKWDATVYHLTANFRSGLNILRPANRLLTHAPDRLFDGELTVGRTDPLAHLGVLTADGYTDSADEGMAVVDGIVEAIESGTDPDEIAVLYRTNAQSGPIELECIKRGLLYRIVGSRFFDRREVRTVIAFLALCLDEANEEAWRNVSRAHIRGMGAKFLKTFPTLTDGRKGARRASLFKPWKKALKAVIALVESTKDILESDGLGAAIINLSDAGIRAHYRDEAASDEDETDVDVALDALFDCAEKLDDVGLLVTYASDMRTGKKGDSRQVEPRITLCSIHRSKGLEWDYVANIGWTSGTFPNRRAPLDEEIRLSYVSLTRARNVARVSWTLEDAFGQPTGPGALVGLSCLTECAALAATV